MPSCAYMGVHVGVKVFSGLKPIASWPHHKVFSPCKWQVILDSSHIFLSLVSKYSSKNVSARRLGSKSPHQLYPVSFAHHLKQFNLRTRWLNLHGAHSFFASLARRY